MADDSVEILFRSFLHEATLSSVSFREMIDYDHMKGLTQDESYETFMATFGKWTNQIRSRTYFML